MRRYDDPRVQSYLSTKDIMLLATLNPDGAPLITVMWFLHDPEAVTLISVDGLQKVKNLRRDGRVCVVAESADATGVRGVTIQGRATFVEDSPARRALVERFLQKYAPRLEKLWGGRSMPHNRVMFRITPTKFHTWGLS